MARLFSAAIAMASVVVAGCASRGQNALASLDPSDPANRVQQGLAQSVAGYDPSDPVQRLHHYSGGEAAPLWGSAAPDQLADGAPDSAADPMEKMNRSIYRLNTGIDTFTFKPIAKTYRAVVPTPARKGVSNVLDLLGEPWSGVNALAQGKVEGFFITTGRIAVNAVFGLAGLFDTATKWGLPAQDEDFGQTLAVWGVGEGPYMMVPFFGPSNPRDFAGLVTEFFLDPKSYALHEAGGTTAERVELGVRIINFRTEALDTVDKLVDTSTDPYAAIRSAYRQQRAFQIRDGKVVENPAADDMFDSEPATDALPGPVPDSPPEQPAPPQ